jgi:hypothetical protein
MKHLTATICLTLAVLLGSAGESFALPPCQGSPRTILDYKEVSSWSNCEGEIVFGSSKWDTPFLTIDTLLGRVGLGSGGGAGSKYVGEWKDGKYNGKGIYTYAYGDKYVAEFKDGNFNGQGTYTSASGNKYVGGFQDDKFNGQGTYTSASGDKYVGEHKDGNFNGQGTYTSTSGDKYVGEHKDGNFNGQGTYTSANGDQYVGEYKGNKRNGQGTYTFTDGSVYEGIWKNDEFQYTQNVTPTVIVKKTSEPSSVVQEELEILREENARLKDENKPQPTTEPSPPDQNIPGSLFPSWIISSQTNMSLVTV